MNHPKIVQLHEIFEGQGHIYMVEDLCEGGNLLDRFAENNFKFDEESIKIIIK